MLRRTTALLGLAACLGLTAHAQPLAVQTSDGLRLELSAKGQVAACQVGEQKLPLTGPGGFSVIDYQNQPTPPNLVPNAGFEEGAQGWSLAKGQEIDKTVAHSGAASVRITVPGPEPGSSSVGRTIEVKPGRRYRVGLWMRRQKAGVCGAYVSELDSAGKLAGKVTQMGLAVPTKDDEWRFCYRDIETGPQTAKLLLRGDIYRSTGTVWLDDFTLHERGDLVAKPVEGVAQPDGKSVKFQGKVSDAALELQATFAAGAAIRVDGELKDTSGKDRAVGLRFDLPVDAKGWTWFDDPEERRTIDAPLRYQHTYNCESGEGVCSIYPWSALSGPQAGLSLALPLAQGPRVFLIEYDHRRRSYAVTFFLGLSPNTAKFPSRAAFSFVLYRHDPMWGMRSATARYYELFPESFKKRPTYEGYLNYANLERLDAVTHRLIFSRDHAVDDGSDFGEGYRFVMHLHGCYDFRMFHTEQTKRPPDNEVFSFLETLVKAEEAKPIGYCPTKETIKKIVFDSEGQIRYIGDTQYWKPREGYNHTDKPGWGLNFRVNEDPDVSDALAKKSKEALEKYAQDAGRQSAAGGFDACLTADAIEGYSGNAHGLDYRPEHIRAVDFPLTFGRESLKPAITNTIWDFHSKVWWPLTEQHKVLTYGNANCYEQAFTLPFCDIPMTEFSWDREHPGRLDRYLRAMVYQKIWRHWRVFGKGEKDRQSVLEHFEPCLASAVFPSVYGVQVTAGSLEPYRALYRQYVPAIEMLSAAGWEPIPYARTGDPDVVVERFGAYADNDLHLTFRNYSSERKHLSVALDLKGLGVPTDDAKALMACDLLLGFGAWQRVTGDGWKLQVEPSSAKAFWIGSSERLMRHSLALTAEGLRRVERLFKSDLSDANRAMLSEAKERVAAAAKADTTGMSAAAEHVHNLLDQLEPAIATKAPVDKAKVFYRLRTELSAVAVGALGEKIRVPRPVEGFRGDTVRVPVTLINDGPALPWDLRVNVLSPWPEAAQKSGCEGIPLRLQPGEQATMTASLFAPATPERELLPFLIQCKGTIRGRMTSPMPFTLSIPVDVVLKSPLSVAISPARVFRGESSPARVVVRNALSQPARGAIRLGPHAKIEAQPPQLAFDVPASDEQKVEVTLAIKPDAHLGDTQLPFAVTSDDARLKMQGSVTLTVGTPVPRVSIRRLEKKPILDGDLNDAAWQSPPTIPEFKGLRGGEPAAEKTAVWMAYADDGIYVAFRCAESNMAGLKAEMTERGSPLYKEDDVEFFLLPEGQVSAFQFAINALGTQNDNFGNTAPWRAAGKKLENGWSVEAFVPYLCVGVKAAPARGTRWSAQFGRQQKGRGEVSAWTTGHAFNAPASFGELMFEP